MDKKDLIIYLTKMNTAKDVVLKELFDKYNSGELDI